MNWCYRKQVSDLHLYTLKFVNMKKKLLVASIFISFFSHAQNAKFDSTSLNNFSLFGDIGVGIFEDDVNADLHILKVCQGFEINKLEKQPYLRLEFEKDYTHLKYNYPNQVCNQKQDIDYNERWDFNIDNRYLWFENSSRLRTSVTTPLYLSKLGSVGIGNIPPTFPHAKLYVERSILISNSEGVNGYGILIDDAERLVFKPQKSSSSSKPKDFNSDDKCILISREGQLVIGSELLEKSEHYSNYKLSVCGKIVANEFVVVPLKDNWADFVFDDNYKFLSLSELDKYISLNKHLPDVPTQEEVRNNGYNLNDMNTILLRKVEELTLYLIDQNKEMNILKKEVHDLQKLVTTKF